jgi:hypothetical protein
VPAKLGFIFVNSVPFGSNDCAPYHYAYLNLVREEDILPYLRAQQTQFGDMISAISEVKGNWAYAPGKWSVKQVIQHVIDTERIFAFRLLALSRGEQQPIPGFEQNDYADAVDVTARSTDDLRHEFDTVRDATISLLESLHPTALEHRGIISGHPVLAGALPYILAGHVAHHVGVLTSKYGL